MEVKESPSKVYTNDELNVMPMVQNLKKKIVLGEPHDAFLTIEGANFLPDDYKSQNEKE